MDEVAERLGVSRRQVQAINPRLICCQLTCYGGAERGGWEYKSGWEPTAQFATGTAALYGSLERPQLHGATTCCDILGGAGLAFSALLGVYQQLKTGYAGEARTSLAQACQFIQLPFMISESRTGQLTTESQEQIRNPRLSGQHAIGKNWYQRLYACADGWLYVSATVASAPVLAEVVSGQKEVEETALATCFLQKGYGYWLDKLAAADIACHQVMDATTIYEQEGAQHVGNEAADETSTDSGKLFCRDLTLGFPVLTIAEDWVLVGEQRSFKRLWPSPIWGQHTEEVLSELGYDQEQINRMLKLSAVESAEVY